jgi:hypothetical protein
MSMGRRYLSAVAIGIVSPVEEEDLFISLIIKASDSSGFVMSVVGAWLVAHAALLQFSIALLVAMIAGLVVGQLQYSFAIRAVVVGAGLTVGSHHSLTVVMVVVMVVMVVMVVVMLVLVLVVVGGDGNTSGPSLDR